MRVIPFFLPSQAHDCTSASGRFYRTGGVITTAGVIMVLAFGSLLLSTQMLLVQAGFFLSFSVLLDTFVVRSLLVPAIMVLLGPYHWWPARMPPVRYSHS